MTYIYDEGALVSRVRDELRAPDSEWGSIASAVRWAARHVERLAPGLQNDDAIEVIVETAKAQWLWRRPGTDAATAGPGASRRNPADVLRSAVLDIQTGGIA